MLIKLNFPDTVNIFSDCCIRSIINYPLTYSHLSPDLIQNIILYYLAWLDRETECTVTQYSNWYSSFHVCNLESLETKDWKVLYVLHILKDHQTNIQIACTHNITNSQWREVNDRLLSMWLQDTELSLPFLTVSQAETGYHNVEMNIHLQNPEW